MTATIFLVRHAAHAQLEHTLSGRSPGIALSADGARQAELLGRRLADVRFAAVHTSPVQRARETAAAIARGRDAPLVTADALDEVDFGRWTGMRFADLEGDRTWADWNGARGSARAADGETMAEAQARIVRHIEAVAGDHAGSAVALVSHCDMIRSALAHYLSLALDHVLNFDVDPGSVSRLAVGDWGGRVLSINEAPR